MTYMAYCTRRHWRFSARLRELDDLGGDAEEVQDCINELTANALHAPTEKLRRLSQGALDAHHKLEHRKVHGI